MSESTSESTSEPTKIGQYEVLEQLGAGAAGAAYRARHAETGDEVAVKLLHAQTEGDIELQQRFVREAGVLERLDHPNIVRHCECGIHDDKLFLAMELVSSGTLNDVLKKRGPLPWRVATEAAIQICDALTHAHEQGVIHRDLKPANLFLSGEGEVKVGDFGLARDLHQSRLTVEGQTVGTCKYMAPEQVQGKGDLTGAVDLYALGCLLFEMLSGRAPFDGATLVEVFEKHLFADPPNVASVAPSTPPTLAQVVQNLLAKKPEDRPADAAAAKELLQAVLRGETLPESLEPTNLAEQLAAPTPEPAAPNVGRLAVVFAIVVAVAIGVWVAMRAG
ncbi:MAG: serine/threonine-protein kinase [Planctomycetota bacterium]